MREVAAIVLVSILLSVGESPGQTRPKATISDDVRTLIAEGKPDSALALATSALSGDTANVKLLLALADAHKAKRQTRAWRGVLDRVLRMQPRSIDARIAIAEDFLNAKQLDSAAYFAHSALVYSNRRSADAYYWLGRVHHQAGQPDSALYYYRAAWGIIPSGSLY